MLDLRGVHDDAEMIAALAITLDLHHEPKPGEEPALEPRRAQIIDALHSMHIPRLLLDHVEHLHAPLQDLLSRLEDKPHTSIIMASRRAMTHGTRLELRPPSASDAHTLLLDCIPRSRRSAVELDAHTHELLDALEHNPLAIKVCAPRLGLFKPRDILKRLEQNKVSNTHTTLSEAFAWSWDMLDDSARNDLSRCAACSGWFDDALATHLLDVDSPELAHQRLSTLRDHSLLESELRHGAFRYRLAKPLQLFIEAHPVARITLAQAHMNLARYISSHALELHIVTLGSRWNITPILLPEIIEYHQRPTLRWWQQAWDHNHTLDTLTHLVKITLGVTLLSWKQQDFAQLSALHTYIAQHILPHPLVATLPLELRVRLICARSDFFSALYNTHAAYDALKQLDAQHDDMPPELELLKLVRLAEFEPQLANDKAQAHIDRGIVIARELDQQGPLSTLMIAHANVLLEQRQMNKAIEAFEEARDFCETLPNKRSLARLLLFYGFTLHEAGQQLRGREAIEQSREAFIAQGDVIGAAHALRVRVWQSVDDQEFAQSKVLIDDMLAIATRHGLGWMHAFGFFLLGQHELDQKRYLQALIAYERARYHLERNSLYSMLAASQLYRSICYKLTGDMEMARRVYEEGKTHLDSVRSTTGKLHYMCEQAEWLAVDGERREATDTLKRARALLDGCREQDMLSRIAEVYQCKIDLAHYFTLLNQKKPTERLYRSILQRLSRLHVPSKDSDKKPLDSCIEVRLAWALLQRQLPEEFLRRFLVELQDPLAEALIIDTSQRAYRAPGCYDWISLGKKANPYNLLLLLIEHHLITPGEPVDESLIMQHLWPNEQLSLESARNRLYVTLSSLRNSGDIKTHVLNQGGSYMMSSHLEPVHFAVNEYLNLLVVALAALILTMTILPFTPETLMVFFSFLFFFSALLVLNTTCFLSLGFEPSRPTTHTLTFILAVPSSSLTLTVIELEVAMEFDTHMRCVVVTVPLPPLPILN